MAGRAEEARESTARGRAILLDLGGVVPTMAAATRTGVLEEMLGNLDRAEEVTRAGVETLSRLGEKSFLSTLAPQLGRILARKERLDDAEEMALLGKATSPPDDWASQVSWRMALALTKARRGDFGEAEQLLREALALSDGVDYTNQVADIWFDLADVLRLAGRTEEAGSALREALALQEVKGNRIGAAHTRGTLAELEQS
jgi:tetratricopeptide (TPR) repeat protein